MQIQNRPLFSIVIPTYNASQYIVKAIQCIIEQSFQNFEIVILDAHSTDATVELIQTHLQVNEQIKIYVERDKGIYDAMNRGIELAKGEWIYFMGSDDALFNSDVLTNVVAKINSDTQLIYGDVLWVPNNVLEEGICTPQQLFHRNINHQRIFYRKELFAKYGVYDLQYQVASDHELNIRFFSNNSISKQYIPLTIARYHSGGFSANKLDTVFWSNWKTIFKKNFSKHLPAKEMYNKLGWYCRYQIDRHNYAKAFVLFCDVFVHTFSPGFVKLTFLQLIKSFNKNAG